MDLLKWKKCANRIRCEEFIWCALDVAPMGTQERANPRIINHNNGRYGLWMTVDRLSGWGGSNSSSNHKGDQTINGRKFERKHKEDDSHCRFAVIEKTPVGGKIFNFIV